MLKRLSVIMVVAVLALMVATSSVFAYSYVYVSNYCAPSYAYYPGYYSPYYAYPGVYVPSAAYYPSTPYPWYPASVGPVYVGGYYAPYNYYVYDGGVWMMRAYDQCGRFLGWYRVLR